MDQGLLRLVFVPVLQKQCPEFFIDASARTDIDDINRGFVVIGTENHAIRSDPKRPIAGKLVMEGIALTSFLIRGWSLRILSAASGV